MKRDIFRILIGDIGCQRAEKDVPRGEFCACDIIFYLTDEFKLIYKRVFDTTLGKNQTLKYTYYNCLYAAVVRL